MVYKNNTLEERLGGQAKYIYDRILLFQAYIRGFMIK